jgi:hypothetical protein
MVKEEEKFDAHLKLAEFYMEVRKNRRQHEWRVSVGLWVALAGGIISVKSFPKIPTSVLAAFLLAVVIGHAWLWVWSNYWRNERDAKKAYGHSDRAEKLLNSGYTWPEPHRRRPYTGLFYGTTVFELLATLLLSVAWIIVNSYRE